MTTRQSHAPLPGAAAADPADASHEGSLPPSDAAGGPVGSRGGRRTTLKTGPSNWLLAPALSFFGIFALLPLAGVVVLSFFAWDGLGTPQFAGLTAWFQVFQDPVTLNAMWLTLLMTLLSYVVQFPLSLLLGAFMAGHQRYREVFSVLYFLPLLFSAAAVGIAFKALLDPNFGLSRAFGLDLLRQDWLGSPTFAFYTLIMVISWSFVPFHSLLYQAGVRQIPASMYEAATLDGAGRVRQFFNVTLPQLKYTIVTSSTLMLVGSLTYF
ncbi:MAG: sugar ABC transporter permease, partial [Brachybacterium sp.]|nr:sugar ABC transporter permease [Brachybacterium sp.]